MLKVKSLFLILGLFLLLVNSKPLSKKLFSPKKSSSPKIYEESHPKEFYERLLKEGMEKDNLTQGHPPYPFYEKMDYKEEKKRRKEIIQNFLKNKRLRKLSTEEQTLENLGFIGLIQNYSSTQANRAMRFVVNNIKKDDSRFILYPYPFKYTDKNQETPKEVEVNEGGFFTLNQSALNDQTSFTYLRNISNVNIGKAKGIYDIDIAILSLVYEISGIEQDVFREASTFCNYFTSTISKTSTCLAGKNAYLEFKQQNPNKGAVVRLSPEDILNNTLYDSDTNQLKFKLLIIPDYVINNERTILSNENFNSRAVEVIKKFRNLGGNIITSGKSGYLLELMEMIEEGTYDKTTTLYTSADKGENTILGCQDIYKETPEEQSDFLKQLICLGYKNNTVLSNAFVVQKIPEHFEQLIYYDNRHAKLYTKKNGKQTDDKDKTSTYPYIVISKQDDEDNKGKGIIFLVNGNPIENSYYFENVRNMILYTMSRDIIFDLKIKFNSVQNDDADGTPDENEDLPIPAGEEGVQLLVSYQFYNLFTNPLTNFKLEILFAKKIDLINTDKLSEIGCELKKEKLQKYEDLNLTDFNIEQYLLCQKSSIDILKSTKNEFLIEITDYSITARLIDIPLMYSSLSYSVTENGEEKTIEMTPGIFYAQAAIAALLRGTINKDPSSDYPMRGKGLYFDLVLTVENKENTKAKDVNFVSVIPLVTPLVDGEDEGLIARVVPIYEEYYFNHEYYYPWLDWENRVVDYIDYAELAGKGVCYVDDFDTPVKLSKNLRDDTPEVITNKFNPETNITLDEGYGAEKGISQNTLLRQIYFGDSEKFYETAAARKSVFIDTTTEKGAEAYYGDVTKIPEKEKDLANPNVARAQLAFIRLDTYFYSSKFNQYQVPNGFDGNILISIDNFDQSNTTKAPINGKILGDKRAVVYNKGHYDSSLGKFNTLKENEYTNAMRQYPFLKKYDPTKEEDLKALQDLTTDTLKLSHFMVPNKDEKIFRAGNILGFKENDDQKSGYLEQYPSVKFVYGHSIELILPPNITRLGGLAEIILPSGVNFKDDNPIDLDRITVSADNVAFFKTEYDKGSKTIKLHFRRGLMPNENYGLPSKCEVYIEELDKTEDFDITLKIYDLKYDFSSKKLETYYPVDEATKTITAVYKSFYSFPCLIMGNTLTRKNEFSVEESHEIFEYEIVNPFARYGGYFQELTKHTTVFGSAEAHHVTDPGFQGSSGGFSIIHNIGTSSIPFAEFLNHGTLMIPGAVSTSRLEWKDVWGRFWSQNLRSIYPDIPPIPPAPLNYIMTTTFELITNTEKAKNQERVIEWQSDESVYIRVQMKMRNTYQLYWEPTLCHENQRAYVKENNVDYGNPIFIEGDKTYVDNTKGDEWDINLGFTSSYGLCYGEGSYASGQQLESNHIDLIQNMVTCAATLDPTKMTECSRQATQEGLPIVKRRPDTVTDAQDTTPNKNWNYSPKVEAYLPEGYINTNKMWQLTMDDYSDDPFYKGYPWHLDDCIPNLDNGILKPHDIIAFPIFKGLGYNITYDPSYSIYKFKQYKGWWSDQLQNKDHTLLAGQQRVSQVSVNHESLIDDDNWINAFNLKQNEGKEYVITNRLKNLYVCMFNRHRVKITPGQTKYSFLKNVYQNNVIPILPDLEENDKRYDAYECKEDSYQYDIYNISQVDNRVYTGNDRDWLYFAAGLRGNAMEDINVILKLDPLDGSRFEGITKIQDGGRFTYWEPPDGPNSYQYFDSNVNTVISKRVDLTILGELIPGTINTFNTYMYELFSIKDEKEKNREYTLNTYMNSHGYGDATTTVYVGGIDATSCRVNPGEMTYVKIVFYNNAGFDWEMKPEAITLNEAAYSVYLNSHAISSGQITAVQYPSEYKFMSYEIPEEIKPYVTLTPSMHVMDVSPQFFDLTFNNILTIKDALEGDYFYCLNVTKDFPDNLKGKLWEIKMTLNKEYFNTLPSKDDVTNGYHDYELTIPSIRFGVPTDEGKIYYNLGQARNMYYTFRLYKEFEIKGIKIINEDIAEEFKQKSTESDEDKTEVLYNLYNSYPSDNNIISKIKYSYVPDTSDPSFYNLFTINLTEAYPLFPFEVKPNLPYQSELYILIQSYSPHSPYGYRNLMTSTKIKYSDGRKNKDAKASPSYINIYSRGPHLAPEFSHKIAVLNDTLDFEITDNQEIYNGDELTIELTIKAKNEGSKTAYNPSFYLKVDKDAQYIEREKSTDAISITEGNIVDDKKIINVFYKGYIINGDYVNIELYFRVQFGQKSEAQISFERRRLSTKEKFNLVKEIDMSLCLTEDICKEGSLNYGKQISDKTYSISYKTNVIRDVGKISLKAENIGTETKPKYKLTAEVGNYDSSYDLSKVTYTFYRLIENVNHDWVRIAQTTEPYYEDEPEIKDPKNYKITYKVIGEFPNGKTLDSISKDNYYTDSKEEEKKEDSFPAYAIALICILGAAIIAGGAFMVYKFLIKKGLETATTGATSEANIVKNYGGQFEKVEPTSPRGKKRRIQNKSTVINVSGNANANN